MYFLSACQSSKSLCLSFSIPPPDKNFGLDYHMFQHMVGDCPPDFLQLAFNCCNVSPPRTRALLIKIDQSFINPQPLVAEPERKQPPCTC